MSDPEIVKEIDGSKGRFLYATEAGDAELTISILSPGMVIADHTEVPQGLEGQGIGQKLVEALIADARAECYKIVPLCPYVNAQRRKHPEWAELFSV